MVPLVLFYLLIIYSSAFQKIKKEVKAKNSLQQELWDASNAFESLLRQKSRASWLKGGDCNTVYFHKLINFKSFGYHLMVVVVQTYIVTCIRRQLVVHAECSV